MIITNGTVLEDTAFRRGDIRFSERIESVGEGLWDGTTDCFDASGCYVLPGLVDIHTHGALGYDFTDGNSEAIPPLSRYYMEHGVTSYLATTMTAAEETLKQAVLALPKDTTPYGARCMGVHLEGPFLSPQKCGAQNADYLHLPDLGFFERVQAASDGRVRMVTVAPELAGAISWIRAVTEEYGIAVSLGHTAAGYEVAKSAFQAGASHVTHLFNAMNGLHHREPGVIGAALESGASVELICDNIHVHPAAARLILQAFGERVTLVSDSIRAAGMPEGCYLLGGLETVLKDGRATLLDGTLAGSTIALTDAVRNCHRNGIPLEQAAYAASTAPAEAAGLRDIGRLKTGYFADIIVLDGDTLRLKAVFIGGRRRV